MKKIVLSIAGVMAAVAFAPEASAIPSFARQTGMACTACHAQHFPVLNGFGRAFKAAGYTMMGAQEKVEGDHLSIPSVLNASILLKYRYVQDNRNKTAGAGVTAPTAAADGQWQMGDEFSLFFGGRVAENIGFMIEGNIAGGNPVGGLAAGIKLPITFDMGGAKLSIIPFATDALGVAYGYELSSGGVMRANRWNELRRETSAIQYIADASAAGGAPVAGTPSHGGAASGFAFVAQNDMGFINITKWSPSFAPGANAQGVQSTNFKNNYLRLAVTPNIGDWGIVAGAGTASGSSYGNLNAAQLDTRMTFFDFQAQGEVGGKELSVYAQHANAPVVTPVAGATVGNVYNVTNGAAGTAGVSAKKAWTIGADYSVIPHTLSVGAAYRNARNGTAAGVADGDNSVTIGAVYDLAQNVALHANYATYSGSAHTAANALKHQYLFMLEAAW